jgi:flagellar biosynthetic protein FliQ
VTDQAVTIGAWLAFAEMAGPVLVAMLAVGLAAGILQTATQIREASLPFVLKLASLAVMTSIAGKLMMHGVEDYATRLLAALPGLVHG